VLLGVAFEEQRDVEHDAFDARIGARVGELRPNALTDTRVDALFEFAAQLGVAEDGCSEFGAIDLGTRHDVGSYARADPGT
jgi:hypothetical protein